MINKKRLTTRIKKHEGFSDRIYFDQFNNPTIGYGHLIKLDDKFESGKKYTKKYLSKIFITDLDIAIRNYRYFFKEHKLPTPISEVIIEMIFQLGIDGFLKFRKMISAIIENNFKNMVNEMLNSKWYGQTPKRVKFLIDVVNKYNDEKS